MCRSRCAGLFLFLDNARGSDPSDRADDNTRVHNRIKARPRLLMGLIACAALAVCVLSNGLARVTNRPAQLFQLPGMILLVPGSFGFVSLGQLLAKKAEAGVQEGFTMALVGAALVIGVLVANVVMPPRKLL